MLDRGVAQGTALGGLRAATRLHQGHHPLDDRLRVPRQRQQRVGISLGGTDNDALLDNVSVMVVPEPRTYALFGAGLLALAGLVSRRRAVEFGRARASGRST